MPELKLNEALTEQEMEFYIQHYKEKYGIDVEYVNLNKGLTEVKSEIDKFKTTLLSSEEFEIYKNEAFEAVQKEWEVFQNHPYKTTKYDNLSSIISHYNEEFPALSKIIPLYSARNSQTLSDTKIENSLKENYIIKECQQIKVQDKILDDFPSIKKYFLMYNKMQLEELSYKNLTVLLAIQKKQETLKEDELSAIFYHQNERHSTVIIVAKDFIGLPKIYDEDFLPHCFFQSHCNSKEIELKVEVEDDNLKAFQSKNDLSCGAMALLLAKNMLVNKEKLLQLKENENTIPLNDFPEFLKSSQSNSFLNEINVNMNVILRKGQTMEEYRKNHTVDGLNVSLSSKRMQVKILNHCFKQFEQNSEKYNTLEARLDFLKNIKYNGVENQAEVDFATKKATQFIERDFNNKHQKSDLLNLNNTPPENPPALSLTEDTKKSELKEKERGPGNNNEGKSF